MTKIHLTIQLVYTEDPVRIPDNTFSIRLYFKTGWVWLSWLLKKIFRRTTGRRFQFAQKSRFGVGWSDIYTLGPLNPRFSLVIQISKSIQCRISARPPTCKRSPAKYMQMYTLCFSENSQLKLIF